MGARKLFARSVGDIILPGLLFWHDAVRILSDRQHVSRQLIPQGCAQFGIPYAVASFSTLL